MTAHGHTRLKVWLVLLVVFALGSVTGAALTGLYRSHASGDRPGGKDRFEKMRRDLNLTEDQTKSVSAILDETRNEYRSLRAELRPRFEEPRQKARTRIRALTPEQQQKFDAMVVQQDAQREGEQKKQR